MRERIYNRKFVRFAGSVVLLLFLAGIPVDSEAEEAGSGEREASVTFKGTYEQKEEEKKEQEQKESKLEELKQAAENRESETEAAAQSVKSLPQTGETGNSAGMGILISGIAGSIYLLRKSKG